MDGNEMDVSFNETERDLETFSRVLQRAVNEVVEAAKSKDLRPELRRPLQTLAFEMEETVFRAGRHLEALRLMHGKNKGKTP